MNSFIDEVAQNNRVVDLMKNNYGNFVVQKALKLSSGPNKLKLIRCIVKNIEKIGDRKIILKWKSIVESHICPENEMLIRNLISGCNNNTNIYNNLSLMGNIAPASQQFMNNLYPIQNFQMSNNNFNNNLNMNLHPAFQKSYPEMDYNVNTFSNSLNSNNFYNNHQQSKVNLENSAYMSRMNNYNIGQINPYVSNNQNNSFNFVNTKPNNYHTQFLMENPSNINNKIFNAKNMQRKSAPSDMSVNNNMGYYFMNGLWNKNNN